MYVLTVLDITLGENSFKINSFILHVRLRHDTVILILSTAKTSHLFIFWELQIDSSIMTRIIMCDKCFHSCLKEFHGNLISESYTFQRVKQRKSYILFSFIFLPVKKTKISSSVKQVGSPQRKMCYQNFETEKTKSPNFISKELKYC